MKVSIYIVLGCVVVSLFLGMSIGFYFTPEYQFNKYDKTSMDLGMADHWLDLRYINAMIEHHRGAMLLANQALKYTERKEMKELAGKVLTDEPLAIAELYEWKKQWYGDKKTVRDPVVSNLGTYDEKFDLRFLNALIAHHEAGFIMTSDVKKKSSRTEILNNADVVDVFLSTTLKIFKDWRKEWYSI
ncbi:MAG: DUF305 domain-containing protein [Candidatus Moraniibacteriota bacterium]|nr:MAG: DUF305 domain-containing protein [Candidatus Moranbacteria bacterium]